MEEKKPVPAWVAFENVKLKELRDKEIALSLFYLKEWLDKHEIIFTEGKGGNLVSIPSNILISRKEITKLLLLTKGRLGIQFFNGEIAIYELGSKMDREQSRVSTQNFLDKIKDKNQKPNDR